MGISLFWVIAWVKQFILELLINPFPELGNICINTYWKEWTNCELDDGFGWEGEIVVVEKNDRTNRDLYQRSQCPSWRCPSGSIVHALLEWDRLKDFLRLLCMCLCLLRHLSTNKMFFYIEPILLECRTKELKSNWTLTRTNEARMQIEVMSQSGATQFFHTRLPWNWITNYIN